MGYRPDEQSIEQPTDKIIEGIEEFYNATKEREKSNEWQQSHIDELNKINKKLFKLKLKLTEIRNSTW